MKKKRKIVLVKKMFDRCSGKNEEIACVALTDPPLLKPDHHQCSFVVMVIDRVIDGSPAHSHQDNNHHHHGEVYCLNSMVGGLSGEYSKAWFKPTHFGSLGGNFLAFFIMVKVYIRGFFVIL